MADRPNFEVKLLIYLTISKFQYLHGQAYYYSGKTEAGKQIWRRILTSDPDMKMAADAIRYVKKLDDMKEEANQLVRDGKIDDAIAKYQAIIDLDPYNRAFNSTIYGNMSSVYLSKKNDAKEALKMINKSVADNNKYAKGFFKRAEIHMKLENWGDAENDYRTANGLDSTLNLNGKIKEAQKKVRDYKKNRDFYKVLEVDRNATDREINKAFRKLSLKYHPDKASNPDEKLEFAKKYQEIRDAHEVLKDPKKKKQFDNGMYDDGSDPSSGMGGGGGFGGGADIFQMFFGGMGGGGRGGGGGFSNFDMGGGGGMPGFTFKTSR